MMNSKKIVSIVMLSLLLISSLAIIGNAEVQKERKKNVYLGQLNYAEGNVTGRFVRFHIEEKSGELEDYTIGNMTVFDEISYENDTVGRVRVHGAVLTYKGVENIFPPENEINLSLNFRWRFLCVHDNPAAVLHIITYGSDVIKYKLNNEIHAEMKDNIVYLNSSENIFAGRLIVSNGEVSIINENNERKILIKTGKNYTTSVIFINFAQFLAPKHIATEIMQGIEKGRIGANIYISTHGVDFVNYSHEIRAQVKIMERNRVRVEISSELHQGKVIMIVLNKSAMEFGKYYKLNVTLDGIPVPKGDYQEVMNSTIQAKYVAIEENGNLYLLLYIPHFSTHIIDIESGQESSGGSEERVTGFLSSSTIWIIVLAIIVIGIIAAVIIKAR